MSRFLFLLSILIACKTSGPAPTPVGPNPTTPAYAGPRTVKKGDRLEGDLRKGQVHAFRIELAAAEHLKIDVEGKSGPNAPGSGCGNWFWRWTKPDGAELTMNPLGIAPDGDGSGVRRGEPFELVAQVPEGGDLVGLAGVWSFELGADGVNCESIHYKLAFD